jgi:hypothetical protein
MVHDAPGDVLAVSVAFAPLAIGLVTATICKVKAAAGGWVGAIVAGFAVGLTVGALVGGLVADGLTVTALVGALVADGLGFSAVVTVILAVAAIVGVRDADGVTVGKDVWVSVCVAPVVAVGCSASLVRLLDSNSAVKLGSAVGAAVTAAVGVLLVRVGVRVGAASEAEQAQKLIARRRRIAGLINISDASLSPNSFRQNGQHLTISPCYYSGGVA